MTIFFDYFLTFAAQFARVQRNFLVNPCDVNLKAMTVDKLLSAVAARMFQLQFVGQMNLLVVLQNLSLFELFSALRANELHRIRSMFCAQVFVIGGLGFVRNVAFAAVEFAVFFDVLRFVCH